MAISLFGAAQMTSRARRARKQVGRRKTNATGPHRHAASRKQSQRTRARKQDRLTHREQTGGRQMGGRAERGRGLKRDKPAAAQYTSHREETHSVGNTAGNRGIVSYGDR